MQLLLIAIAVAAIMGFTGGWKTKGWAEDSAVLAQKAAIDSARTAFSEENAALGARLEDKLGKIRVVNKTINNEVQREIQTNTVYANPDCRLPNAGKLLDDARGGGTAGPGAGQRDSAVPAAPANGKAGPATR